MSFSQRQKTLMCLWSKNVELQKCGHTEKSNYGLNLSIILMFLTIYGVGKWQCDRSTLQRLIMPTNVPTKRKTDNLTRHLACKGFNVQL